jgi:hypothetical protein
MTYESAGGNPWEAYEGGGSIGQRGSEEGLICQDEEHPEGCRITLERDTTVAPFAITCGVYGWFLHTRYFSKESESRQAYRDMKAGLEGILALLLLEEGASPEMTERQTTRAMQAISEFVERFP